VRLRHTPTYLKEYVLVGAKVIVARHGDGLQVELGVSNHLRLKRESKQSKQLMRSAPRKMLVPLVSLQGIWVIAGFGCKEMVGVDAAGGIVPGSISGGPHIQYTRQGWKGGAMAACLL